MYVFIRPLTCVPYAVLVPTGPPRIVLYSVLCTAGVANPQSAYSLYGAPQSTFNHFLLLSIELILLKIYFNCGKSNFNK